MHLRGFLFALRLQHVTAAVLDSLPPHDLTEQPEHHQLHSSITVLVAYNIAWLLQTRIALLAINSMTHNAS
jgi:hypothetical protein